ncbi:tetratricopeptide repeat protein [Falsirhodobacter halotolerans]|uniref:tetratricopeptide repeat protein n=1 Tax=Falsirhodobacter halotolerans TaxID=1146892 RepID=UPI001FD4ECFD|nr:tetratricopeptide repeat protein [Falsirhodobacter halotolerans]MCJ8140511.1 tetratricopeptide repeat protein [Falsirhodobacter halotolerans]
MPDQTILRSALLAAALFLPQAAPAQDAGAYLAAVIAANDSDHRAATRWFDRALESDANNPALLESAIVAHIAAGDFERAGALAQTMGSLGLEGQALYIALVDRATREEDWDTVLSAQGDGEAISLILQQLVRAWATLGGGNAQGALAGFDAVATTDGLQAFGLYHKALALASVGDMEGAEEILGDPNLAPALTRRGVLAHIQVLSQLDRNDDAQAVLEEYFSPTDPTRVTLSDRLAAGETLDWDIARTARDGVAEVFYTLASALQGEAGDTLTLVYARVATDLRPDQAEAQILTGDILSSQGQTELAIDAYDRVDAADPLREAADIARADALFRADRPADAVEALAALRDMRPDALGPAIAYADALRRTEAWEEAVPAYDRALALIGVPSAQYWPVLFSRGIAHERLGQHAESEADMRAVLDLQPDQPDVLNYLGYTLVEQGRNLDEALGMIERAVAAEPGSGAIQDSLAWALFQLGRFPEAVPPIEIAVGLEPSDPILTDHLGDIYWAVGRRDEARFQWRRALEFDPTEAEVTRIRRKLEVGLRQVLTEEGRTDLSDKIPAP